MAARFVLGSRTVPVFRWRFVAVPPSLNAAIEAPGTGAAQCLGGRGSRGSVDRMLDDDP
jgi:hypothetical protein